MFQLRERRAHGVWMRTVMGCEQRGEHDPFYFNLCAKNTGRAYVFLMLILSACLSQPVVTVVQGTATLSRTDSTHTRGSSTWFVSCPKPSHFIAQCHTLHLT